jgi:D-arabinose 1-dehydrogenase-like Zn-dependent alcohol dehydrogenase
MVLPLGNRSVIGSYSRTAIDSKDTLGFSVRAGVRPMNQTYALERVSEGYDRMMSGKARFRVVLTIGGRPGLRDRSPDGLESPPRRLRR